MSEETKQTEQPPQISINERSIEVLIAKLIPTSQYFEARFDGLEQKFDYKFEVMDDKINQLAKAQDDFKGDMDRRFAEM